ncbi:MAG: hypothetical protein ACYCS7_01200 [Acidimicrobiales bacterium]
MTIENLAETLELQTPKREDLESAVRLGNPGPRIRVTEVATAR